MSITATAAEWRERGDGYVSFGLASTHMMLALYVSLFSPSTISISRQLCAHVHLAAWEGRQRRELEFAAKSSRTRCVLPEK